MYKLKLTGVRAATTKSPLRYEYDIVASAADLKKYADANPNSAKRADGTPFYVTTQLVDKDAKLELNGTYLNPVIDKDQISTLEQVAKTLDKYGKVSLQDLQKLAAIQQLGLG